jgi:hypothetical protein
MDKRFHHLHQHCISACRIRTNLEHPVFTGFTAGQVYEYVVPFAEQGIALIVRRTGSGASQNLDGSQFTAQLALDLELSGIDLAAIEKHGWVYSHHRYPPRSSGR